MLPLRVRTWAQIQRIVITRGSSESIAEEPLSLSSLSRQGGGASVLCSYIFDLPHSLHLFAVADLGAPAYLALAVCMYVCIVCLCVCIVCIVCVCVCVCVYLCICVYVYISKRATPFASPR